MTDYFVLAGFGCVVALALWKATRERWFPALLGMLEIGAAIKWADNSDLPSWLIFLGIGPVLAAGFEVLRRYDKWIASKVRGNEDIEEEPEFTLDATTAYEATQSGWDRWTIFPKQNRLTHDYCGGGPPNHEEVYEYAVRHTSVFVRLIEQSMQDFNGHEYEVFGGSVIRAKLDRDFAKQKTRWEQDDFMLKYFAPEAVSARLQQQEIAWHEVFGAIRYFVLSKASEDYHAQHEVAQFFGSQFERLKTAYAAFDEQVKELGAVYNARWDHYDAPEGATPEVAEDVRKKLSVFNFGFHNLYEFQQKDEMLSILKGASGKQ